MSIVVATSRAERTRQTCQIIANLSEKCPMKCYGENGECKTIGLFVPERNIVNTAVRKKR